MKPGAALLGRLMFAVWCALCLHVPVLSQVGTPRVRNGIDILREQDFAPLRGKRVGLITNHTGLAADGISTVDLLRQTKACRLVALFSPEHGIRGVMDTKVSSTVDESTGLQIHSLYGDTRRPTPEMIQGLDALVFDIQDVGARFYTFATTMAYAMEEAAKAGIPFYVLDRPNPIGGMQVEGPLLDEDKTSFIGYMPMPVRHGMTVGELAGFYNQERKIGAELRVIKMEGWKRDFYFESTGQIWVNPSPNMRSLLEAILYPGVCLLEATNVSVGRGTDRPFEVVGAPWIDPRKLTQALEAVSLPGVSFVPLYFTPEASTHQGKRCGGVNLVLTDRKRFHSVRTGLALASTLARLYPREFDTDKVVRLLGNSKVLEDIKSLRPLEQIMERCNLGMDDFLARRSQVLLYPESDGANGQRR